MKWYKKVFLSTTEKILIISLYPILVVLITLLVNYFLNWNLEWKAISPFELGLVPRIFLSAIGFFTIWAFLYWTNFYRYLYKTSRNYRSFKKTKKEIWKLVIIITFILVQIIIFLLNKVAEFLYNFLNLLLFITPWIWITTLLYLILWLWYLKYKKHNIIIK